MCGCGVLGARVVVRVLGACVVVGELGAHVMG